MATKIRGITIDIGADTSGLQKSLDGVNKELKETQSQLKDVDKLLKLDPKNTELLAQKQQLLSKAIEQSNEKLEDLKDAAEKMKARGVEESSEQFQALQREIIATEQSVKGYEAQMTEAGKATKEAGDKLEKTGSGGAEALRKMGEAAKNAVNEIVQLGKAVVEQVNETAAYGDNVDKMSQRLNMTTKGYQEWAYVLGSADVSIDSMTKAMSTMRALVGNLADDNEDAIATFAELGLTIDDIGDLHKEEVFAKIVEQFQQMPDTADRAALATKFFGKSAQEMIPLFNMSVEETRELIQAANDYGLVMSDDAIKASATYSDSLETMQKSIAGAKNKMFSEFLPAITEVTDGLALLMSGQEGGEDAIAEGVMAFLDKIVSILPSLTSSILEVVKSVLELIVKNIPTILNVVFDLIDTLLDAILDALPTLVPKLIAGIIQLVAGIIGHLPEIIDKLVEALPDIVMSISDALLENLPILIEGVVNLVTSLIQRLPEILGSLFQAIWNLVSSFFSNIGNWFSTWFSGGSFSMPAMANGGTLWNGTALVGEKGPELLTVNGGRATVTPLTSSSTTNNYNSSLGGVEITINTQPGQNASDIADAVSMALAEQYSRTRMVYG